MVSGKPNSGFIFVSLHAYTLCTALLNIEVLCASFEVFLSGCPGGHFVLAYNLQGRQLLSTADSCLNYRNFIIDITINLIGTLFYNYDIIPENSSIVIIAVSQRNKAGYKVNLFEYWRLSDVIPLHLHGISKFKPSVCCLQ